RVRRGRTWLRGGDRPRAAHAPGVAGIRADRSPDRGALRLTGLRARRAGPSRRCRARARRDRARRSATGARGGAVSDYQPSAAEVKTLRDATGAGMMECKRALQEAGG